jgi:basic membrane lipoprotein Med (substrate-binding protein (PBP1-ABC) superfamily)
MRWEATVAQTGCQGSRCSRFWRSVALAVAACGKSADERSSGGDQKNPASDKKVALVIAQGGLGDKSYNDLANSAFTPAGASPSVWRRSST